MFHLAKQIEGVYENIIACATKEFLNKGYADASLRTIAAEAHTTTGSIYTRFGDKEGLFDAIVGKHYNKAMNMYRAAQEEFASFPAESQPDNMASISGDCMYDLLLYCYENLDIFKLILLKSEGTKFSHMIDEMVEIKAEATHKYLNVLKKLGKPSPKIDAKLEHMIITGMFNTYFELVIHEMPIDDATLYLKELRAFYTAGWMKIMGQN